MEAVCNEGSAFFGGIVLAVFIVGIAVLVLRKRYKLDPRPKPEGGSGGRERRDNHLR